MESLNKKKIPWLLRSSAFDRLSFTTSTKAWLPQKTWDLKSERIIRVKKRWNSTAEANMMYSAQWVDLETTFCWREPHVTRKPNSLVQKPEDEWWNSLPKLKLDQVWRQESLGFSKSFLVQVVFSYWIKWWRACQLDWLGVTEASEEIQRVW